jgi:hypothetical protein
VHEGRYIIQTNEIQYAVNYCIIVEINFPRRRFKNRNYSK